MARPILQTAKRKAINLRVNQTQKAALEKAAASIGMPTSTWIIETCLKEAERCEKAHLWDGLVGDLEGGLFRIRRD